MGATSYVDALLAIIPDVTDSIDVAISNATAAKAPASANDNDRTKDALTLASSLRESVEYVQDTLASGGACINKEVLEALSDSVECCRLLASALSSGPCSENKGDGAQSAADSRPRRGDRAVEIGTRVLDSMEFLCDIAQLKECSVEQRRLRKCTRVISEDYQVLTLLLHDRSKEKSQGEPTGPRKRCCAGRASFAEFSSPTQLSSKFSETKASLEFLSCRGLESPESRRSRSIDRQLRDEHLQPWTRSDCVMMPQALQWAGLFKPSLAAFTCDDRQKHIADLRNEAVRHVRRFIDDDKCWDETCMPEEAHSLAAELRTRMKKTDETLTDEELELFERLWSFEPFRSIANDIGDSSMGKVRGIMRNDDYVLTVGDVAFALRKVAFAHVNHFTYGGKQISIVDPRGNPSLRKQWKQRFGQTPTFIVLFDLNSYDKVSPDAPEFPPLNEYLDFFNSITKEPCLRDTTFLLFLVNAKQFREKVKRVPMADYVPGFRGGDDPDEATSYLSRQFTSFTSGGSSRRSGADM